ncbi:MAG TPA: hypothetical protein VGI39_44045 [Polyangiaceae bacterium]|jgi:RNAse (barnase) inhibitor barstar
MPISVEAQFVEETAALIPDFRPLLDEHRADNGEILAYLAVADFARLVATALERDDEPLVERSMDWLEKMASHPDERISRDLLGAGVFEALDAAQLRRLAVRAGPRLRRALTLMEPESIVQAPADLPVRVLDGASFDDLEGFCVEFSKSVLAGAHEWRGNLDALNDILRGGFGTPHGPWVLRWQHARRSREALGWPATKRWLRERMQSCHPTNVVGFGEQLADAENERGQTLFERIISIVRDHGAGGAEAEDGVALVLEE